MGTYAPKTPRGRPHDFAARVFDYVEDAIYVIVAVLLVVAGAFVLWGTVSKLVDDIAQSKQVATVVTDLLDNGLLLFIIAELLHTVRATIQERTLIVEPFLIVALIAGVRRLLVITAQLAAGNKTFTWAQQGIEITVLVGLIVAMTLALVLYHRVYSRNLAEHEA